MEKIPAVIYFIFVPCKSIKHAAIDLSQLKTPQVAICHACFYELLLLNEILPRSRDPFTFSQRANKIYTRNSIGAASIKHLFICTISSRWKNTAAAAAAADKVERET
jgi:hypothetical protein